MADSDFWIGALGGLTLAMLALANTLPELAGAQRPKLFQAWLAWLPVAVVYSGLGGTVGWVFEGRSGAFVSGLTAIGFLTMLVSDR